MRRFLLWTTAAAAALALPATAMAATPGFTVTGVNLHAGPGGDYPVVDRLPAGARVRIQGCVGHYAWCSVASRGEWGWVPGDDLQALYRGRRVVVVDYGPDIGLPIVGFSVDTYWREHYRNRGFYAQIDRFRNGRATYGGGNHAAVNTQAGPSRATVGTGSRNAPVGMRSHTRNAPAQANVAGANAGPAHQRHANGGNPQGHANFANPARAQAVAPVHGPAAPARGLGAGGSGHGGPAGGPHGGPTGGHGGPGGGHGGPGDHPH
jgi:uncharacterized protein YraI